MKMKNLFEMKIIYKICKNVYLFLQNHNLNDSNMLLFCFFSDSVVAFSVCVEFSETPSAATTPSDSTVCSVVKSPSFVKADSFAAAPSVATALSVALIKSLISLTDSCVVS